MRFTNTIYKRNFLNTVAALALKPLLMRQRRGIYSLQVGLPTANRRLRKRTIRPMSTAQQKLSKRICACSTEIFLLVNIEREYLKRFISK